jgi:pyrroline-5-carboxylate reductase
VVCTITSSSINRTKAGSVGVMGSAILSGVLDSCAKTHSSGAIPRFAKFIACVNSQASAERLETRFKKHSDRVIILVKDNIKGMQEAEVVMLGCKPYMVEDVLGQRGVEDALKHKLLISFVVGTPHEKILSCIYTSDRQTKDRDVYIIRGMMNIAAEFGESMTVIDDVPLPGDCTEITEWIFSQLGKTALVTPNLFDVGGVMAGAGAGFLTEAIDGMLDGGVAQGIKRAEGRKILSQVLRSLAALLEAGNTPDGLREKFSSPRGTTIEGLMSLEEDRVRYAYCKALIKATKRSQEM